MNINKYLNCIDIIYWINLDRSLTRKNNMSQILKNINIQNQRISATDGKLYSDDEIYNKFYNNDRSKTKIEYACLLSHLNTIKVFNESNYNIALILEDDISLEYLQYWNKTICEIIHNAPIDWEIIMLNYSTIYYLTEEYTLNKNGYINCAQAYLINKNGSSRLMNSLLKNNKYVLHPTYIHTADNYIFSIIKTYAYKYPYFTYPINNDSTIHNLHLSYHNYCKSVAFNTWNKLYKLNKQLYFINFINYTNFIRSILFIIIIILLFFTCKIRKNKSNINQI